VLEVANNGADGYAMGVADNYDAVILDLGLPRLEGIEVLRRWRGNGRDMPVLILTARGSWTEKVDGLNAGADDYITKPFHVPEIAARLKALIRRRGGQASPIVRHGSIVLDEAAGTALNGDVRIELTALELKMLSYFMHRIGRIIPQGELMEHLYPAEDSRESNTIEVYVSRLRRKLGRDVITTIRGLGYKMD
jgi:DNA-binding response OmpR family regulator